MRRRRGLASSQLLSLVKICLFLCVYPVFVPKLQFVSAPMRRTNMRPFLLVLELSAKTHQNLPLEIARNFGAQ